MLYTKGKLLIDGGEGYIYEVAEDTSLLMKVYKETDSLGEPIVTSDLVNKLLFMIANPPSILIEKGIIAWPLEAVWVEQGDGSAPRLSGFVMPKMAIDEHIQRVYSYRHPQLDMAEYASFPTVVSRISIAINLCAALHELHRVGYVVGDFNHRNIGVNYNTGQIYFVDCDSFHITDNDGNVYRSNVIMAGYLAPEIISHCNSERTGGRDFNLDKVAPPTFTKESDLFCLAVHIFKLMMNGVDPFRGVKSDAMGSTASPFVGNDAIERNAYVFKQGNKPSAVFCPPMESVPPEIFLLFEKAFIQGAANPRMRPDAETWYHALNRLLTNDLVQCPVDAKHQYYRQLTQCPYCTADYQHMQVQGGGYASASLPQRHVSLPRDDGHGQQLSHNQQPIYGQQFGHGQQMVNKRSKAPWIVASVAIVAAVALSMFLLLGGEGGFSGQDPAYNGQSETLGAEGNRSYTEDADSLEDSLSDDNTGINDDLNSGSEASDDLDSDNGVSDDQNADANDENAANIDDPESSYPLDEQEDDDIPQGEVPMDQVLLSITASSTLPAQIDSATGRTFDYLPDNVVDGDIETIWALSGGIGEWIHMDMDNQTAISGMYIKNGYWRTATRLSENNRVRRLLVEFSNGESQEFELPDPVQQDYSTLISGQGDRLVFDSPQITFYVRMTILDVYGGSRWDDTCITGIELFG